jgi:hypothetical protein
LAKKRAVPKKRFKLTQRQIHVKRAQRTAKLMLDRIPDTATILSATGKIIAGGNNGTGKFTAPTESDEKFDQIAQFHPGE